ncbi:MAG: NAD(P)/FAD-dependent oxidoreductase [Gemmatimonadaceae bacterium]
MTEVTSPDSYTYDVAVIGGGPAGLTAALWLARYLHSVVLVDSGDPRNWETRGINGFLGAHSIRSPELRKRGRADAEKYGAVLIDDKVETAKKIDDDCYRLKLAKGDTIEARRLLLAIGIRDAWPNIPGLADCYGETAHVCPDCDGYETRDQNTVVIGSGEKAVGMALALTTWTDKIVICTNGEKPEMDVELLAKLKKLNIPVLQESVTCIKSKDGEINCMELADGMTLDCERLYFAIGQYPSDDLGAELGCARDDVGRIVIDERNHATVKNVYAAGDIAPGPQMAIAAAASGAIAALAIHHSLVPEERRLD